jgi:hypothetical protein
MTYISLQFYSSEQEMLSQLDSDYFGDSFTISQGALLDLSFFLCYSVLNTHKGLNTETSKVARKHITPS